MTDLKRITVLIDDLSAALREITRTFMEAYEAMRPATEWAMTRIAIQEFGICESDIKRVETVCGDVILFNGRRIHISERWTPAMRNDTMFS